MIGVPRRIKTCPVLPWRHPERGMASMVLCLTCTPCEACDHKRTKTLKSKTVAPSLAGSIVAEQLLPDLAFPSRRVQPFEDGPHPPTC